MMDLNPVFLPGFVAVALLLVLGLLLLRGPREARLLGLLVGVMGLDWIMAHAPASEPVAAGFAYAEQGLLVVQVIALLKYAELRTNRPNLPRLALIASGAFLTVALARYLWDPFSVLVLDESLTIIYGTQGVFVVLPLVLGTLAGLLLLARPAPLRNVGVAAGLALGVGVAWAVPLLAQAEQWPANYQYRLTITALAAISILVPMILRRPASNDGDSSWNFLPALAPLPLFVAIAFPFHEDWSLLAAGLLRLLAVLAVAVGVWPDLQGHAADSKTETAGADA
jgi:hypothetical protein